LDDSIWKEVRLMLTPLNFIEQGHLESSPPNVDPMDFIGQKHLKNEITLAPRE
jgi:hypothetical protein